MLGMPAGSFIASCYEGSGDAMGWWERRGPARAPGLAPEHGVGLEMFCFFFPLCFSGCFRKGKQIKGIIARFGLCRDLWLLKQISALGLLALEQEQTERRML